ncbi:MAG: hypothetical protein QOI62_3517 [Solirubrobacteraceae bacterium]|nr:hypothetical protein [Solirubrobacteraceae bacterium]
MQEGPHRDLMLRAIAREGDAHRAALEADPGAADAYREAAGLYRASWEAAPPASYGRLVGMLKAAILAGDPDDAARYVQGELGGEAEPSPPAAYALAVAALLTCDDASAARHADEMRAGSPPFGRAADALAALAGHDGDAYRAALETIVADFAARDEHLTGVRIADTAAMLEALAAPRGLAAGLVDPVLPPAHV